MSNEPEHAPDGELPTLDACETLRAMMHGSKTGWRWRLLLPCFVSLGLHLFLLPFVLVITVTFADELFVPAAAESPCSERDRNSSCNRMLDGDYPVARIDDPVAVPVLDVQPPTAAPRAEAAPMPEENLTRLILNMTGEQILKGHVQFTSAFPKDVLIEFWVATEGDGREIAQKVLLMPQLASYRVDLRIHITGADREQKPD